MPESDWTLYSAQRPEPGTYQWRVPSRAVPGMTVTFYAEMRRRWSGYAEEYSPAFDYWDGYKASVPPQTEWRLPPVPVVLGSSASYLHVTPEGDLPEPCPFCARHPRWEAIEGGWGSGQTVCAKPYNYDNWRLVCCAWAASPRRRDPRQLLVERGELLAAYRVKVGAAVPTGPSEEAQGAPLEGAGLPAGTQPG